MIIRSLSQPLTRITRIYRMRSESWRPSIRIHLPPKLVQIKSLPYLKPISVNSQYHSSQDEQALKNQLEFKQEEIDVLKGKLKQQQDKCNESEMKIKMMQQEWDEKYEQLIRAHNQEIVQLKCNLDNSIFDDNQDQQDGLAIIQEENEYQQQKSFAQQDIQQDQRDIISLLEQFELEEQVDTSHPTLYIQQRIKKMIEHIQKIEIELEDWKRNYWALEKKYTQLQLQEKQGDGEEIEIEFDFENKQIIQTNKGTKQQQNKNDDINQLKEEIERLKQINQQLLDQQRLMNKQLLENLIFRQKKSEKQKKLTKVNEPCNKSNSKSNKNQIEHKQEAKEVKENREQKGDSPNKYFSNYFQTQQIHQQTRYQQQQQIPVNYNSQYFTHRHSAMSVHSPQFTRMNTTIQSKEQSVEKMYNFPPSNLYSTPIIVKQSSLSPYQKTKKQYLQF